MKKILAVLCSLGLMLVSACKGSSDNDLSKDKIYFFYQTKLSKLKNNIFRHKTAGEYAFI